MTQLFASCRFSLLEQMCGFRKYTTCHLTLISSLSEHLRNRDPDKKNPIYILLQSFPHDNTVCNHVGKWKLEITLAERLPHASFHLVASSVTSTCFIILSHNGFQIVLLSSHFLSCKTERNKPFSRCMNKHSKLGTFHQTCSINTFSNCRTHCNPAKGCPYKFRSRSTTGS